MRRSKHFWSRPCPFQRDPFQPPAASRDSWGSKAEIARDAVHIRKIRRVHPAGTLGLWVRGR